MSADPFLKTGVASFNERVSRFSPEMKKCNKNCVSASLPVNFCPVRTLCADVRNHHDNHIQYCMSESLSPRRMNRPPPTDYLLISWQSRNAGGSFYISFESCCKADFRNAERGCSVSSSECRI